MADAQKLKVREMRAQGMPYQKIADTLGLTRTTVFRWADPEHAERARAGVRSYKARNRAAIRAYDNEYSNTHRTTCPHCGHEYGIGSGRTGNQARLDFSACPGCREYRTEWIMGMWDRGHSMREIQDPLGWTKGRLSVELHRLREAGYYLPYRSRLAAPRFPDQVPT